MNAAAATGGLCIHALPAGIEVLRCAPQPFSGVLPDALGALDPATLARLEKDLAKLVALLARDEKGAQVPLAVHCGEH